MFHNKFVSEQRNYTMACLVNFAECKMKQKCTPDNRISEILDFYSKPQKITETPATPVLKPVESKQEDSMQLPISLSQQGEIATDTMAAIDVLEDVEYSKSGRESTQSKPNTSNFANAHIF